MVLEELAQGYASVRDTYQRAMRSKDAEEIKRRLSREKKKPEEKQDSARVQDLEQKLKEAQPDAETQPTWLEKFYSSWFIEGIFMAGYATVATAGITALGFLNDTDSLEVLSTIPLAYLTSFLWRGILPGDGPIPFKKTRPTEILSMLVDKPLTKGIFLYSTLATTTKFWDSLRGWGETVGQLSEPMHRTFEAAYSIMSFFPQEVSEMLNLYGNENTITYALDNVLLPGLFTAGVWYLGKKGVRLGYDRIRERLNK